MAHEKTLNRVVDGLARNAHENNFESRRGMLSLEMGQGTSCLALYDNNPFEHDTKLRDRVLSELEDWCEEHGMPVLGRGAFGGEEQPEYTRAIIIDARDDKSKRVVGEQWEAIIMRSLGHRPRLRIIKGAK